MNCTHTMSTLDLIIISNWATAFFAIFVGGLCYNNHREWLHKERMKDKKE